MLTVGLSGGIGAGKSTVARALQTLGALVVDSDLLAREVVDVGTPGLGAIVEAFGPAVLGAGGTLDRARLADLVFRDEGARARLNAIVHPLVRLRSAEIVSAAPRDAIVVHDIPLLVENRLSSSFPLVAIVDADPQVRRDRLLASRPMSAEQVDARMSAQATTHERRQVADVWLDNSGSPQALERSVRRLWRRLVTFERNLRALRAAPRARRVSICEPDPEWAAAGARAVARIAHQTGGEVRRIDHIGSTSVAGLAAKDVIDIQVVVETMASAQDVAQRLVLAGLVPRRAPHWDRADWSTPYVKFMARNADPGRAVNVHIRPGASPWWREALLLREWLRAHPEEAGAYAAHKRIAAAAAPDIDAYAEAKAPWLGPALERAGAWAGERALDIPNL